MIKKYDPVDYMDLKKAILDTSNVDKLQTYVQELKEVTNNIPGLIRKASDDPTGGLQKQPAARGPKAVFYDPLSLQYALGYKDRRFSLTYDTLRRIAHQVGIIAAIINTRVTQVASFSDPFRISKSLGFRIKHKSPDHLTTESEQEFIERLEMFIANCGEPGRENPFSRMKRPKFESFLKMIVRDSLIFDQIGCELVPRRNGSPFEFWPVDASTLRLASPDRDTGMQFSYHHRNPIAATFQPHRFANMYEGQYYGDWTAMGKPVRYVQVVNGQIENVFTDDEMLFGVRNPRTDILIMGYGLSECEQIITTITSILYAEDFNRCFFSQGAHPKGILNFKGDNWSPEMLECVAEDSMIPTDRGILYAGTIHTLQEYNDIKFKFWNGHSFEFGFVSEAGVKPLVNIELEDDTKFRVTENHRVFVLTDTGKEERFVSDLQEGDILLQNEVSIDNKEIPLKDYLKTYWDAGSKGIPFEIEEIGEDLWEVIGWQVGDGYLSKDLRILLLFYHADKDIEVFHKHEVVLKKYGIQYKERENPDCNMRTWQICHIAFSRFLVDIGIGGGGRDKQIPWYIYSQSKEKRAAFLRGLFSADGYVTSNRYSVAITSIYPVLWDGIQTLLGTLGLASFRVIHSHKNAMQIYLRRRDEYKERVGFCQQYKMDWVAGIKQEARTPSDPVPLSLLRNLLEPYREKFEQEGNSNSCAKAALSAINKQKKARILSRNYWKKFFEEQGDVEAVKLLSFRPVRIKSMWESKEEMTYDVTIDNQNEPYFIVDGILTHNSFKRQWVAQIAGSSNSWKTPVTQSEGIEWIDLQKSNNEMGFQGWLEYLIKITSSVFLIDPSEINFDLKGGVSQTPLFESSQEWKLKSSRDKGLKPLLKFIAGLINEHIVDRVDDHFCFEFAGLDELTEQEKHELLKEQLSSYMTLNEVRRQLDMNEIPGGVGELPLNPTLLQLLQLQQQREDKKQEMEQQAQQQAQQAQGQADQQQAAPQPDQDPTKEQAVRHKEEKHPLEMQLLEQKVAQGGMQPQPGQVPQMNQGPQQESEKLPAETNPDSSQGGQDPLQELSQNMVQPSGAGPDMQSTQGMTPAQASQPTGRPSGDARKQYAALFGKSVTFDDFVEFMRTRQ